MPAVRVKCPECGAPLASDQPLKPGALVDCARCRLLFIPTAGDLSQPNLGETDAGPFPTVTEVRRVPKPIPVRPRRRRPAKSGGEAVLVLIASVVMLVLAGAAVGVYVLAVRGTRPTPAPPVTTTTTR